MKPHTCLLSAFTLSTVMFCGTTAIFSSPAAKAAEGERFVVLPGQAPRFTGPQGREADVTELLQQSKQTGGSLGLFRQTIAP